MTESTPLPAAPQLVEDIGTRPDHTLAMLVGTINALPGMEVGVTLHVGGQIVSGLVIAGRIYFEQVADLLEAQGGAGAGEALAGVYRQIAEQYRAGERANRGDDSLDDDTRTGFIHLRLVNVLAAGGGPVIEHKLWRGQLSAVGGWSFSYFGQREGVEPPRAVNE